MPLTMDGPMVERFQAGLFSNLQKVVNGNVDCDGNAGLNLAKHTKGHEINRLEILNGAGGWEDHKLLSFKVELRTEQSERD